MSSVVHGFDVAPRAIDLLRQWEEARGDPFALYHRLLSVAAGGGWAALDRSFGLPSVPRLPTAEAQADALIQRFGFQGLRRRLAWTGASEWMRGGLPVHSWSASRCVAVMVTAGLLGELIAEQADEDPSTGFLAGYFGFLGLAPVSALLGRVRPTARFEGDPSAIGERVRWEREQIRRDSLVVGSELLALWGFSEALQLAVRGLAHPLLVATGRPLTLLAHVAVRLAPSVADDGPLPNDRLLVKCLEALGLSLSALPELATEAVGMLANLRSSGQEAAMAP